MQVITRPHIFSDRDARTLDLPPGGTVLDILAAAGWALEMRDYTRVYLNDREIPEEWWPRARPKEGAQLRVLLVPGKGKQGKGIGMAIASLAIAIVAPYAGPAIAGALTGAGGAVSATSALGIASTIAFTAVGSLAVNALFKPAAINNSPQQVGPNSSPAYSISGQSNAATPYQPCVKIYGRHKVYPRIVGAPRTEVHGEDQYMVMALDWGYAPLNVSDIRIGDTPLGNFSGVEHRLLHYPYDPMTGASSEMLIYSQDVSPAGLAFTLGWKEPVTARTRPSTKIATLHFYFPQGLVAMHPDFRVPLTNVVEATIEIRNVTANGPWQAFTAAADVTISAPAGQGTTNANGHTFWAKPSVIDADPVTGLPTYYGLPAGTSTLTIVSGRAPVPGNTFALHGLQRTVTAVSGTTVAFSPPLTSYMLSEEARRLPVSRWDGSDTWDVMQPTPIAINVNANGTLIHIEHNVLKPFAAAARCVMPTASEWEFRVTRTTEPKAASHFNTVGRIPFDPSSVFDDVVWSGIDSVEWPFRAPINPRVPRTISELRIRASDQFNGVIAQLNGIASSILPIPGGGWLETANPAWIARDVLCGAWNPRAIQTSKIDDANFAAFAARCDAIGFRCDTVIDYGVRVDALCESVLAASRGTLSRGLDGRYTIIADGAFGNRVQVFSDQNSHSMVARRTFSDVPHALRVKFIDPDSGWEERSRVVCRDEYYDPEAPVAGLIPATKFEELPTFGVANSDNAWRIGRLTLADMLLRPGTYTLEADIEHLACKRGSKVGVQSMTIGSGGESCHVAQVIDARNLRVDVPFGSIDQAGGYGLIVKRQSGGDSGTLACHPIGDKVWRTDVDHGAEVGDVIVWGFADSVITEFVVKAIKPGPDWTATIELTDLGEGVFSALSGQIPPYYPPRGGRPADGWGLTPQGLSIELIERIEARVRVYDMRLRWDSNALAHEWRVYRVLPSGVRWPLMTVSSATALAIEGFDRRTLPLAGEQIVFEVTGVSSRGAESPGARKSVLAIPDTTSPNPPRHLSASVNERHVSLIWSPPEDEDVIAHQLRWMPSLTSLDWTLAEIIAESVPWDTVGLIFPARVGTYMIKTRDSAGNYSVNPTAARVRELPTSGNVLLSVPISLSSGTSQDCTVVAGALKADGIDRFWLRDDLHFWGDDEDLFWRPTVYLDMLWTWSHTVPADGLGTDMSIDIVHAGLGLKVEYSRDAISWSVFPGSVIAESGVYHFRISLQGGATQGIISSCAVTYDVPDLEEVLPAINIDSGGTWLPLTKPFRQITAVIPGLDKTAGGVAVGIALTAITATTAQVKGIDAAGAYSGAKASFIVRGY